MKEFYDVLIVGGGPAGCGCALSLHESNLQVAIVDKESFPRDKVCGDAIPGPTFKVMDKINKNWGVALRNFADKEDVKTSRAFVPNGQSFSIHWKEYSYNSKRIHFDNFLMQLVRKETNTDLLEGKRLKELEMNSDFVLCKFSDGSICKVGMVIGADGANSVVKRYVEHDNKTNENSCAAVRAYVEGVSGLQEGTNEFYYLKNYLPGYLWIFPLKDGAANIGFGMEMKKTKSVNLREMFLKIIQEEPIISSRFKNAKIVGEVKGFGLPMFSKKRKISGQRVLLCGDAASLIDPLMGHGIDKAFTSGYLAAKQIELCFKNNDFSLEYAALYDQSVYNAVGSELKRSKQLVQLINKSPFVINLFAKLAQNKKVFNWLVKVAKI